MSRKKAKQIKSFTPSFRSKWLAKRHWPFQISVIHPMRTWRITAGIYDTYGEGATFEEAVDNAINNERERKKGFCTLSVPVITEIPLAVSRQMMRGMEKLTRILTNGKFICCPRKCG